MRWRPFLKFLPISKHHFGGWEWNLSTVQFGHTELSFPCYLILLDSFKYLMRFMLSTDYFFKALNNSDYMVFFPLETTSYSLDWLWLTCVFLSFFFFPPFRAAKFCKRCLEITICVLVSFGFGNLHTVTKGLQKSWLTAF